MPEKPTIPPVEVRGIQMIKGCPLVRPSRQMHPERRAGEIYLGAFTAAEVSKLLWKTIRLGVYCINTLGEAYLASERRPVFVRAGEMRKALGFRRVGYLPEEGGNAQ
jgi:hypothetical protein